jgi:hypothetical protein
MLGRTSGASDIVRGERIMFRTIFLLLTLAVPSFAQIDKKPDVWEPFKYFVGAWEGPSHGEVGSGKAEREYKFALNGTFLEVRNRSVYGPQEKNGKGDAHEDFGFVSYDQGRKKFVFRQFHVEGFVNQYVLSIVTADNKSLTWETESIENIEPGWRARERYKIVSNDEFVEIFELAPPGKEFSTFTETTFKRKR